MSSYDDWKLDTPPRYEPDDPCPECGEPITDGADMCDDCWEKYADHGDDE